MAEIINRDGAMYVRTHARTQRLEESIGVYMIRRLRSVSLAESVYNCPRSPTTVRTRFFTPSFLFRLSPFSAGNSNNLSCTHVQHRWLQANQGMPIFIYQNFLEVSCKVLYIYYSLRFKI